APRAGRCGATPPPPVARTAHASNRLRSARRESLLAPRADGTPAGCRATGSAASRVSRAAGTPLRSGATAATPPLPRRPLAAAAPRPARGTTAPPSPPRTGRYARAAGTRSEEHTSELQSPYDLVYRLLLEKKKKHN